MIKLYMNLAYRSSYSFLRVLGGNKVSEEGKRNLGREPLLPPSAPSGRKPAKHAHFKVDMNYHLHNGCLFSPQLEERFYLQVKTRKNQE